MQRVRVTVTALSDVPVSWAGRIELIIPTVDELIKFKFAIDEARTNYETNTHFI